MGDEARMRPVRVLVVDDDPVTRAGMVALLETAEELDVVGVVGDADRAVGAAVDVRPDVVVLAVGMRTADGRLVLPALADHARVVALSHDNDCEIVVRAIRFGASGFLVHGEFDVEQLVAALRSAARQTLSLSRSAARVLVELPSALQRPQAADRSVVPLQPVGVRPGGPLSPRECEVMDLVARGLRNNEIAAHLFITEKTVRNHLSRIYMRLGARDRAHAVAIWFGRRTA